MLLAQNASGAEQAAKGALYGGRAIAYKGASSATSGTGGVTKPDKNGATDDDKTETDKNPGEDKISDIIDSAVEAGTASDLTSLDNSSRDGWYDLDSLLQGAKDGLGKSPPPSDDYRINSLTGGATSAGRKLVIHLKDASLSFIGPDGFDPNSPTPDPDWNPLYYYSSTNFAGNDEGATFREAGQNLADSMVGFVGAITIISVEFVSMSQNPTTGDGDYTIQYYYRFGGVGPVLGPVTNNIGVTRHNCSSEFNPSVYCTIVAPDLLWNDLGVTQMAWVANTAASRALLPPEYAGRFAPHPADINVPSQYQEGASILDIVTHAGTDVRIGPLEDGGWYLYSRNTGTGLPTGSVDSHTVYTINPDRTPGGYITPTQLSKSLPK